MTPGKVKTNQDYAGYFKFLTKCGREVRLYSLADGHGPFGDCASRLAVQMLTNQVQLSLADFEASDASADTKTTICEVIRLSFVRVQKALKSDKHTRFRLSGTTMILALVFQNTLFLANLGDSRVIVGSAKDPKASWPSPCVCSFETKMHKPEDKDEKERIYSCGGLVEPYVDEVTGESSGPARVWNRQRMAPGLAISRTLGDTIAHSVGVSSDPGRPYYDSDITVQDITDRDRYIVLASDGVWDCFDSKHIIKLCDMSASPEAATKRIITDTTMYWARVDRSLCRKAQQETTSLPP